MPSASDRIATAVKEGLLSIARIAYRRSCSQLSIILLPEVRSCPDYRKQTHSQLACQSRWLVQMIHKTSLVQSEGTIGKATHVHSWEAHSRKRSSRIEVRPEGQTKPNSGCSILCAMWTLGIQTIFHSSDPA